MKTKNNITPLKVKLTASQVKLIEQGYKDFEGIIFLPVVFKEVNKSTGEYEMVHLIDLPDKVYARLFTCAVQEHLNHEAPQLRDIEIWMEGYAATGEHSVAQRLGSYRAKDFDDAIAMYIKDHPDIKKNCGPYRYKPTDFVLQKHYDNRRADWKIWGCALFDNEAQARESFG